MRVTSKGQITEPFLSEQGEVIYELVGLASNNTLSAKHSLAYVVLPPGKSSPAHFHKIGEETYYVIKGNPRLIINNKESMLSPQQACLITPGDVHQILNDSKTETIEFLAISVPAWTADDMNYV